MTNKYDDQTPEEVDMSWDIELEDGTTMTCDTIAVFTASNKKQYIALAPRNEEDPEAPIEDFLLYEYIIKEDGTDDLAYIEDDEDYEIASDALDEVFDSMAFRDLVSDEDEEI